MIEVAEDEDEDEASDVTALQVDEAEVFQAGSGAIYGLDLTNCL